MTKPIIGISCDIDTSNPDRTRLYLNADYFDSVTVAGGIPLLLPFIDDRSMLERLVAKVDGLLLTGGGDIDPSRYGQELHELTKVTGERRDRSDYVLAEIALESDLPVMGICRGIQILNVAAGGTLCQDLNALQPGTFQHRQLEKSRCKVHEVALSPGSYIADIVGDGTLGVNSTHHQAVEEIAPGFTVAARSTTDNVIEAIEMAGETRVFAVQWHPEQLRECERNQKLFKTLVRMASACRDKKMAKCVNAIS